jgi:hypothetical protein
MKVVAFRGAQTAKIAKEMAKHFLIQAPFLDSPSARFLGGDNTPRI